MTREQGTQPGVHNLIICPTCHKYGYTVLHLIPGEDKARCADCLFAYIQKGADERAPVPMILFCPTCGGRHIDAGEFASKPHHTHACQHCGLCWRPAIVSTVGVQFLPGFKNEETPHGG